MSMPASSSKSAPAVPAAPASLVVPTARLAAALRRDEARRQRGAGQQVWQAEDFIGLGAWLARASLPARSRGELPAYALLGQEQAQVLWAAVVADAGPQFPELRPAQAESLARLMADAEDTVFAYGLGGAWTAAMPLSTEQSLARGWRAEFRRRCKELKVGTRTMLLEDCTVTGVVLAATGASRGFVEAGPVLRGLVPPVEACPSRAAVPPSFRQFTNTDEECDAALDWAFAARAEGATGSIALVCPDGRTVDALLSRAAHWLAAPPDLAPIGAPAPLSAPPARLGTAPLVEHALVALQLAGRLPPAAAMTLLTSPFVRGWRSEFGPRQQLAAQLQTARSAPLMPEEFARLARGANCPGFAALLTGLWSLIKIARRKQPMRVWVAGFQQWLNALGWPGDEGLTAQEQAALSAWQRALDTAAALDLVLSPLSAHEARVRLRQVARGISETELLAHDAIEVLSVEEAAVLRPAHAWVLGLHDAGWPLAPASNPLLPPAMLRRAGVPGSDFAADAARARRALSRVLAAGEQIVLSHAAHDGDTPRRPSSAVAWPTLPAPSMNPAQSLFERWRAPLADIAVEAVPADPAVPLPPAGAQPGGTGVLAAQAACAFRAFALFRLGAAALEDAMPGLDPWLRGEIAHDVMARLWTQLRTRDLALALSPAGRADAIAAAIDGALDAALDTRPQFSGRPRTLEANRLQRLVAQALEADLNREPFEVIAVEAQHELTLGALALRLRIDRIDRLASGARFIIDYKTGRALRKDWALPRPLAPQLPAYALALEDLPLAGIGFAQLRPGDCKLVTEPSKLVDDAAAVATLARLREDWHADLSELAAQFVAGFAELNPRDGAKTCQRCEFKVLCRVHEVPHAVSDEEPADES